MAKYKAFIAIVYSQMQMKIIIKAFIFQDIIRGDLRGFFNQPH